MNTHKWLSCMAIVFFVIGFPACRPGSVISESAPVISTPQPIRATDTPTITPLPSPSPIKPLQPSGYLLNIGSEVEFVDRTQPGEDLKAELFYTGGGGAGPHCIFSSADIHFPVICEGGLDWIGLIGFPKEKQVQVEIFSPEGDLVSSQYISIQPETEHEDEITDYKIIDLNGYFAVVYDHETSNDADAEALDAVQDAVWQSVNCNLFALALFSPGIWRFAASSGNLRAESLINLERSYPTIIVIPDLVFDPMKISTNEFSVGDTVYLLGGGFQPQADVLLGIYYLGKGNEEPQTGNALVEKWLKTNQEGKFGISYVIRDDDLPGRYYAAVRSNALEKVEINRSINWRQDFTILDSGVQDDTTPVSPTITMAPQVFCPGAPATNLSTNIRAYLQDKTPNRVRESPGLKGGVIGQIKPMEQVDILDGPACADGLLWWKVRSLKTDLIGWTAEGDQQGYWLVPLP